MPATYDLITKTTLASTASTVTISGIPATYTDLRLITIIPTSASGGNDMFMSFNGDNASGNYSARSMDGHTSVTSVRSTNQNRINYTLQYGYTGATLPEQVVTDIFNYTNTSVWKTILDQTFAYTNVPNYGITKNVAVWRSTAAINAIKLDCGVAMGIGTTFSLYGIKAA
jgi:hypothetical protein